MVKSIISENEILEQWCLKMVDEVSKKTHDTAPRTIELIDEVKGELSSVKTDTKLLKEISERIEAHVKYTNGCVGENRNNISKINLVVSRLTSGISVIIFLIPLITGIFVYFVKDLREDIGKDINNTIMIHEKSFNESFDDKVLGIIESHDWKLE